MSKHEIPSYADDKFSNKERIDFMVRDLASINQKTSKAIAEIGAGSEPTLLHLGRAQKIVENIKKNWYLHLPELGDMFHHEEIMRALCTSYSNTAIMHQHKRNYLQAVKFLKMALEIEQELDQEFKNDEA
jgi:hypothetical protein